MSDAELARLERAVARGGTSDDRLRLAAHLRRAARNEDALRALLPAAHDDDVRRAIVELPRCFLSSSTWTRAWRDVAPLPPEAGVRWITGGLADLRGLVASPLALAACCRYGSAASGERTVLLDLGTGAIRCEWRRTPQFGPEPVLLGDVLLGLVSQGLSGVPGDVEARDLNSGEALWTWTPLATVELAAASAGLLLEAGEALRAVRLPDPRHGPAGRPRWTATREEDEQLVAVTADTVLTWHVQGTGSDGRCFLQARSLEKGAERWLCAVDPQGRSWGYYTDLQDRDVAPATCKALADGAGFVLQVEEGACGDSHQDLIALDPRGTEQWRQLDLQALALGPQHVLARRVRAGGHYGPPPASEVLVLDRATGALRGELPPAAHVLAARDVVYGLLDTTLSMWAAADGTPRGVLELGPALQGERVRALAALPERLYVATESRVIAIGRSS